MPVVVWSNLISPTNSLWYHNWYRLCNRYCQNHWSELHILIKIIIYIHSCTAIYIAHTGFHLEIVPRGGAKLLFFYYYQREAKRLFFLYYQISKGAKRSNLLKPCAYFSSSNALSTCIDTIDCHTMGGAILWAELYYGWISYTIYCMLHALHTWDDRLLVCYRKRQTHTQTYYHSSPSDIVAGVILIIIKQTNVEQYGGDHH